VIKHLQYLFILLIIGSCTTETTRLSTLENKTQEEIDNNYTISKDIAYGEQKGQTFDLYLFKNAPSNFTIIFLHGGGYYLSDKSKEERYIQPYLQKGLNVINMNYRIKQGIPKATEDLTIALNYLKSKSDAFPVSLKNIILTGFSAGAQIASTVGLAQNNPDYIYPLEDGIQINGIINFSGPTDRLDIVENIFVNSEFELLKEIGLHFYPPANEFTKEQVMDTFEPINYFDKNDPAFFLWYGGKDDQVPPSTSKEFVFLLKKDEYKNKIVFHPNGGHSPNQNQFESTYNDIFKFLDAL